MCEKIRQWAARVLVDDDDWERRMTKAANNMEQERKRLCKTKCIVLDGSSPMIRKWPPARRDWRKAVSAMVMGSNGDCFDVFVVTTASKFVFQTDLF